MTLAFVDALAGFDRSRGSGPLAGVDEAGRGALAGPVVAAAVVCEPGEDLGRVRDSKLVPEKEREELYERIVRAAGAWCVGIVGPDEIDRTNILLATMCAMKRAVAGLGMRPGLVLVDGNRLPEIACPAEAVTGGDRKSFVIAAASIVAKVTRDRIMRERDRDYPGYGFRQHKGYGTAAHRRAIAELGLSALHRRSFRTGDGV